MTDYFPLFIAILVVIATFISAMNHGVIKLLSSGLAAAVLLVLLILGIQLLPVLADRFLDVGMTFKATLGISSVVAILGYTVSRFAFGWIFRRLLGPDSWFHWMVDGVPGGFLSLVPSFIIVFFLFNCTRIAGTVLELNYVATLCQEQITTTTTKIPSYPTAAKWRNGIEAVPVLPAVLDLVDPFSDRASRNTAALFMVNRSVALKRHLSEHPETASLIESPELAELASSEDLVETYQKKNRVELVTHKDIQAFAASFPEQRKLVDLNLEPFLTAFVASLKPDRAPAVIN